VARLQGDGLEELGIPTQRTVAVNDYQRAHAPQKLLAVLGRFHAWRRK